MSIQTAYFDKDTYRVNPLGYENWRKLAHWFINNGYISPDNTTEPPSDIMCGVAQAKRYLTQRKSKGVWVDGVRGGFVKVVRPGKNDTYYFDVVNQGPMPTEPAPYHDKLPMIVVDSPAIGGADNPPKTTPGTVNSIAEVADLFGDFGGTPATTGCTHDIAKIKSEAFDAGANTMRRVLTGEVASKISVRGVYLSEFYGVTLPLLDDHVKYYKSADGYDR